MLANAARICLSETAGIVGGMTIIHGSAPVIPSLHDWTLTLIGAGLGSMAGLLMALTWINTTGSWEPTRRHQRLDERIQSGPGAAYTTFIYSHEARTAFSTREPFTA